MFNFFTSLSTTDKIQMVAIISSSCISIVSVLIALATLRQNARVIEEANKADIMFYITKDRSVSSHSLIIKNFGKSSGEIISLELNPPLKYEKSELNASKKTITEYKNIFLAPNQFIKSSFYFRNYPDKVFNVNITYKSLGKLYTNSYTIDLNFYDGVLTSATSIKGETDALVAIRNSILEVSDKLS
ncbi:hypothetical protein [Clostridium sp. YIM B02500]|uniref:hypothetical protein n=1 Tax=Clostridium sp. YIM B02500 TaxID=2910681 RepID=UPI001EED2D5F|nr:hypothetical protein [Clostridium sp. YIM B02500]